MKNRTLLCLLLPGILSPAFSQKVIELPATVNPPGIFWTRPEQKKFSPLWNAEVVSNVSQPTLTAYLPDPAQANGTALIIAPGGGFMALNFSNEGYLMAEWAVDQGIAAFVLKYRVAPTGEDAAAEFGQAVGDREAFLKRVGPIIPVALADGRAAIEYVRSHAAEFNIKPDRIGIAGFSAGGSVVCGSVFEHTGTSRPDFAAPIYGALQSFEQTPVPDDAMPLFIVCAADDYFGFQKQSVELFNKWNAAGKPVELHLYEKGGHGFGVRKQGMPSDKWLNAFSEWLDNHGWLKK